MLGFQLAGLTILAVMFIGSPSEARIRSRLTHCKGDNCVIGNMGMKEEQMIVSKKMVKIENHPTAGGVNGSGSIVAINGVKIDDNTIQTDDNNKKQQEVEKKDNVCDESRWTYEKTRNYLSLKDIDLLKEHKCWNILCQRRFWPSGPNSKVVARSQQHQWAQDHCN